MLELDVLEYRPLESSVIRIVTHRGPVIHVPFIHELNISSGPGNLDQVALQVNMQETDYSLAEIALATKVIPELVSCARKEDTSELFIVNSAVMLDTMEKVTPTEICHSAQDMMLQESGESSALQIRDHFLELTIARDLTSQLHMKDSHALSCSASNINDEVAAMEVVSTGAVCQSEQTQRVGNLLNEPNRTESPGLERYDSVKALTETGSLAAAKTWKSIDKSPEGFPHDECTLISSSHQCTVYNTGVGDSVKCLEVDHLSCLESTSTQRTLNLVDFPKVPLSFHETSICKEPRFSCINEVGSATCLLEKMEPNTADLNAPKENVPRDKDMDRSVESIQQETETTSSVKQNDISVAYLSQIDSAKTASTRLQDIQSDSSEVVLHDGTSPGKLEDDLSFKPNLPPCFENLTVAKALEIEDCSSFSVSDCNIPLGDGAPDCHKSPCAIKLEDISDPSPHNTLCSAPLASICEETSYARSSSCSLVDHSETSYIDFSPHATDSKLDYEIKEPLSTSVAPSNDVDRNVKNTEPDLSSHCLSMETEESQCPVPQSMKLHLSEGTEKVIAQSQELYDMVATVINDPTTSLKTVEESHCLLVTENSSCGLSDSDTVVHDVSNCEADITSHVQSNLAIVKETVLTSNYLEVPCRTVGYYIDATPSYALVPYIDIWESLSKPEVTSLLSLKEPKNVIIKDIESQALKKDEKEYTSSVKESCHLEKPLEVSLNDNCILKAFINPQEIDSSHCAGKCKDEPFLHSFSKMKTLAQDVTCNVSADSFPCYAECHTIKMHDRISSVPSTMNQSECMCHFNSGALCDSSVALDVHSMSVLPQLVDTLQSEQTNMGFLKDNCTPHLSLSNRLLSDCSDLLLPISVPSSPVALTVSKNTEESHNDFLFGNLQVHVTNHVDSSVQMLDDLRRSLPLKQDTELGPRPSTTFKASDSVPCKQIWPAKVNGPTQSVQPDILNDDRSPCMLHMETFSTRERNSSPVKAVVAVKTKATQVKSQRNIFNTEIKIPEKSHKYCQLLKERPRQSTRCHMEILNGTTGNGKNDNLRPVPQSLKCYALQEAKRPKISNANSVCPASSGLLNCVNTFSQKLKSHNLSQARLVGKRKELPSAIKAPSCLSTSISVNRQLNRRCKNFSTQENVPKKLKTRICKRSQVLKIQNSHDIKVEYKSLPSKHVDLNLISKPHYSKMTRAGASSQKLTHLQKCTQDQMLLNKLSTIANRLTVPFKSESFSDNLKIVPFRGVKFQAKKLQSLFSCVNLKMNFQPEQIWQENVCLTSSRDCLVSQSMNLYPTSFPKTCFSSLGDNFFLNVFDNLTFPVSFHVNVDPSCLSDFLNLNPPDYILRSPQLNAQSSKLSEWTLSLFLSSHVPADTGSVNFLRQWNPQFRSLESSSESSHITESVRNSWCSMLGLHTVLALSSPGCYRLWTRRRNLGSRIPTVQKLSMMQFARGLKGSAPQFSTHKAQFSSLAFSLGRVLSTWSQHGLSAFSSDCSNTHPNCSVWLPSQSSSSISVLRSPNSLVCVPQMSLDTVPQLSTYSLPVQNLNFTLKPKICHQDDLGLSFCLSTQQKEDPQPPCWLSTQYKNAVELSNCSFNQEDGPKFSFVFSSLKEDNLNLPLDPSTQQKNNLEHPISLTSLKYDLKPVLNISLQKDQNGTICLDSQCDVSIQEDAAAVDLPSPGSPYKSQACPFEHRENIIIPCTHSQNKDQVNEKELFEGKPQRVSQIRIRKTIPKPDPNLTPMGLPKPKRVNKKEFSLEDIYTNKNYMSPPPARCLETIFEEPKEKNGVLISVSQQKRKRILEFRDCTVPRIKRPKGKVKVMASCKRGRKAAMEGVELDALLIQKLMDLENCLLEEDAMERGSAASSIAS